MNRLKQIKDHLTQSETQRASYHELNPTVFLPKAAAIEPNAEAIVHISSNNTMIRRSYREFSQRSCNLAYYLREHCFTTNNIVGFLSSNTPMVLEAYFAVPASGGIITAINYRLQAEEIHYIIKHSKTSTLIVDREYYHLVKDYKSDQFDLKIIIDEDSDGVTGEYEDAIRTGQSYSASGWNGLRTEDLPENDTLGIAYTSGTTSRPKGVQLSHRGVYLAALSNVIDNSMNHEKCKYLWTLPAHHALGWTYPWAVCAVRGTNVCLRKMDYPLIWKLFKEERVTHFCAAPTVCTMLLNSDKAEILERDVFAIVAAAPPSPSLFASMTKHRLIPRHVYGLTETYGPTTKNYFLPEWNDLEPAEIYKKMARQGHGYTCSREARVVRSDLDSNGQLVDVDKNGEELGEIAMQGNMVHKGYLDDDEANRKAFKGGYFLTGDIAKVDTDGSISIQDRGKDIIISGGENISSIDVESAIVTYGDVLECAVVAKKDEVWGEIPVGFITARTKALKIDALVAHLRGFLAHYKIPKKFIVVDELPKTSTGKVKKHVLRDQINKMG